MAKLLALVLWVFTGLYLSEASGSSCRTQRIDLYEQPNGSLQFHSDYANCTSIELAPQWGFSVVLSILQYYVPAHHVLSIEDSDGYKIALLGHGMYVDNQKSIISERIMKIRYLVDPSTVASASTNSSTINETEIQPENNSLDANDTTVTVMNGTSSRFGFFYFIYTQVGNGPCVKSEFACQNGKCLPESYVCSGHNRCGDNSDNNNCVPRPPTSTTPVPRFIPSPAFNQTIIAICVTVLCVVLIGGVYLMCYIERSKKPLESPPLQSVSSPPEQPVPEEPPSMCSRVQLFFRKEDQVEDNLQDRPLERFEVPSMYPSLHPTAPEFGRENRSFVGERD